MSDAIWKFGLASMDCWVPMPRGARVLTAQIQRNAMCLWAVVDTTLHVDDTERRHFRTVGTGWAIPDDETFEYIATVQEGALVWHICEVTGPSSLAGIAGEQ